MEHFNAILNLVMGSGIIGTLLFYRIKRRREHAKVEKAEIENTEKVVKIQSEHITRLDNRVEKLEEKVDKLEVIIERKDTQIDIKQTIIRQAYSCKHPNAECPVLLKRNEIELNNN